MNKAQLIKELSAHFDGSKSEAARALNAVVETITTTVAGGEKVSVTGFGVFEKIDRPARTVRNPRTGESVHVEEKWVPFFKTGKELRERLNGG